MKLIVSGSRNVTDIDIIGEAFRRSPYINYSGTIEIVHGDCRGVDRLAEEYFSNMPNCTIRAFPADWDLYGRKAGPIRNRHMAQYSDALLAIWDGQSRGTKNMIDVANELNLRVFVFRIPHNGGDSPR